MTVVNWIAIEQLPCFLGGVDRTRSAFGKARRMIGMCMCEYDRSRRDRAEPPQPVRPTVDHDTSVVVVNEQRAVASVPPGTELDFTPSAEEG